MWSCLEMRIERSDSQSWCPLLQWRPSGQRGCWESCQQKSKQIILIHARLTGSPTFIYHGLPHILGTFNFNYPPPPNKPSSLSNNNLTLIMALPHILCTHNFSSPLHPHPSLSNKPPSLSNNLTFNMYLPHILSTHSTLIPPPTSPPSPTATNHPLYQTTLHLTCTCHTYSLHTQLQSRPPSPPQTTNHPLYQTTLHLTCTCHTYSLHTQLHHPHPQQQRTTLFIKQQNEYKGLMQSIPAITCE